MAALGAKLLSVAMMLRKRVEKVGPVAPGDAGIAGRSPEAEAVGDGGEKAGGEGEAEEPGCDNELTAEHGRRLHFLLASVHFNCGNDRVGGVLCTSRVPPLASLFLHYLVLICR